MFAIFLSARPAQAQQLNGTYLIDSLITAENYAAADSALQSQIEILQKNNNTDSLAYYPYYVGKIALKNEGGEQAAQIARRFVAGIQSQTDHAEAIRKALLELATFYASSGRLTDAYESNERALEFTRKISTKKSEAMGVVENNLGVLARRMGNVTLSLKHHRQALNHFVKDDQTAKDNYFISYNNMGAMMWFSSKTDSALHYYDKALQTLAAMEPVPKNRYYRPANVLNNKAALYSISGRTMEALATMQEAVKKYKQFIDSKSVPDADRNSARQALFRSVENLGGVYKELGDFSKTRELLLYSYAQKKKHLEAESPDLFKAQILLGQIELSLKNYDQALKYLNAGIEHIERLPDDYLFWNGDANYSKALLYDEQRKPQKARPYFERAGMLFEKAFGGSYDAYYLEFLANAALFYAENGDGKKALNIAQKALDYVVANDGEDTLLAFKHRLNLASVYYELGKYREALDYSRQSLLTLRQQHFKRDNLMDSVQVEFKKPDAMLLQAKAEYQLNSDRDTLFLTGLLQRMDEALAIINKRKLLLSSEEDVNIQIANNASLFEFAKKIALELYQQTGDEKYLNHTVGYHESALYNRIRARINAHKAVKFSDVPERVRLREDELRVKLKRVLDKNDIDDYLQADKEWRSFLDSLRIQQPRYFALRYGSTGPLIDPTVPENTTVIRYLFIDEKLYALVLNESRKEFYALPYAEVDNHIHRLHEQPYSSAVTGGLLHDLYLALWQPFEKNINSEKIIIIPDRELFNLSFETLLKQPAASFAELAEQSLLADYAISYNYSLSLLGQQDMGDYKNNFIAFAPGFGEDLKQNYRDIAKDSLFLDQSYLNLLPQPFTTDLVQKLNHSFGGTAFTGLASTEQQFTSAAGGHQIIHIGTHAESNNLQPELSRLFFAKDMDDEDPANDNSLYAYEIYNHNLSSRLTLLTACGTGKPHHQPGEGMISLAHAFNYAGSRSLLTALWNIDEKASSQIVDSFYQNLADGLTKDVALQQAKLSYLANARGRTASPEYWAGLVLLGDAGAVPLEKSHSPWPWLLGGLILFVAAAGYFWVRQK